MRTLSIFTRLAVLQPSSRSRGQEERGGRILTPDQEAHIQKLIVEKRPEQLKMDFALWTRAAVGQLIEAELQIKLSVRGVGKYLKRWGFTRRNRSGALMSKALRRSRSGSTRSIRPLRQRPSGNESTGAMRRAVNTHVHGRSYAPKEKRLSRLRLLAAETLDISTVTNKGEARWMIIDGNFNAIGSSSFLRR